MSILGDIFSATGKIIEGALDFAAGIIEAIFEVAFFIVEVVFDTIAVLFSWIDDMIDALEKLGKSIFGGEVVILPLGETCKALEGVLNDPKIGKTVGRVYPRIQNGEAAIGAAVEVDGNVARWQLIDAKKGFDSNIKDTIMNGRIYSTPIEQ